jgi:hypothetical protein
VAHLHGLHPHEATLNRPSVTICRRAGRTALQRPVHFDRASIVRMSTRMSSLDRAARGRGAGLRVTLTAVLSTTEFRLGDNARPRSRRYQAAASAAWRASTPSTAICRR